MADPEVTYCDDYESIVGPKPKATVKRKVVTPPEEIPVAPATEAETG